MTAAEGSGYVRGERPPVASIGWTGDGSHSGDGWTVRKGCRGMQGPLSGARGSLLVLVCQHWERRKQHHVLLFTSHHKQHCHSLPLTYLSAPKIKEWICL